MSMREEDVVVPFPRTITAAPTTSDCRSTLLVSSLQALHRRGRFEAYKKAIDARSLDMIASAVAGVWMPIDIAAAHYTACDTLGIPPQEQLEIGATVVMELQETFIATVLKFARLNGAIDPWLALGKFHSIHARSFRGGGARVIRLGPKEARLEVVGMPLAPIPYFRSAFRGFVRAGALFFAKQAFCSDVPKLCTATTLGYRLSWA